MKLELERTKLNIFVAFARKNRVIGNDNDLPWKRSLKADLAFLNLLTTQQKTAVIMGRKTFESIKKPLPKRLNIVLTRSNIENAKCFHFLDDAINYCRQNNYFIAIFGGTEVFKEALKYEHRLFCTIIENDFIGDTYFPEYKDELKDISNEVDKLLRENDVKITWELKNGNFVENNILYGFYTSK